MITTILKGFYATETVFNIRNFGIVFLLLLPANFSSTLGQHNGQPLPRVNGESNQMVNLFTGRLSVNMPLANVSGRGEEGTSLNVLNRGAADWQVVETGRHYYLGELRSIQYAMQPTWPSNFRDYSTMSLSFQAAKGISGAVWSPSGPMSSYLVLTTSDGNKVNFRDSLRDGEPTELNPEQNNGPVVQCGVVYGIQWTPTSPPPPPPPNPPSHCLRGKVFHSTDGSGMTFVSDNDVYDAHGSDPSDPWGTVGYFAHIEGSNAQDRYLDGYVYLPNGTKYRIKGGKPIAVTDRNGNVTTFNYIAPPYINELVHCDNNSYDLTPCRLGKITDSIGREIVISYGAVSEQEEYFDTFAYKGFGGAERQIKIYYDRMEHVMYPGLTVQPPLIMAVNVLTGAVSSGPSSGAFNPTVISRIGLPNGQEYQYKYNAFGEIARIKTPTGAYTDYTYGPLPNPRTCSTLVDTKRTESNGLTWIKRPWDSYEIPDAIVRRVTEARLFNDIGVLQNKTIYNDIGSEHPVMVVTKDPSNVTLKATKHYYLDVPCSDFYKFTFLKYFDDWRENKEYKTEIYADENSSVPLRISETVWAQRAPIAWLANHPLADAANASNDPRVVEVRETLETGQVTKKTFAYDQYNNVTDTYEYDFGSGQAGQFIRRSHTDYITDSNYTSYTGSHLKGLPSQNWVSSDINGNNRVALTQIEYDNYGVNELVLRSNVSGHDSINYGAANVRRGNATKVISFSDSQSQTGAVAEQTQYDILGNIVKTIDAKGFVSSFDFSDRFGSPDAEARSNSLPSQLEGQSTFAFVTRITNPTGHSAYTQRDYFTSSVVDAEDANENVSTTFYQDSLDRPTQLIEANNRPQLRRQTSTTYSDVDKKIEITSDLYLFSDNFSKAASYYDSLGRITEKRSYENGGYVVTAKPQFDSLGRVTGLSNPYRPYLNEQPVWTTTSYDALGRVVKVKTPDNQESVTSFFGNTMTANDQADKKRRSVTNALGQITRVDEPDNSNDLGTISSPTQPTYYTYSAAGHLVKVAQGLQNRYFLYDSLGRLVRVRQPEQNTNPSLTISDPVTGNTQWSTGSTYDANGNILSTLDPKGILTTLTYDNLNRVLSRTYSDGTPAVAYQYDDAAVPFSRGQLTKISSSVSTAENTAFDAVGKVISHKQITDGQTYTTAYAYNLSGTLVEETYPSGRIVKNALSEDGKLTDVSSKRAGQSSYHSYANSFAYEASGAVSSLRLGNGNWENVQFNSRLQIVQIGLGTSQGATNLWKANYDYGEIDENGNVNSQKNNGNIARQIVSFAGLSQSFIQSYKYDSLSRLVEGKELHGTTQTWKQNFGYDRYGNRTSFNQEIGSELANLTPAIDPLTNRFTTGQGFTYDLNGNLIQDNNGREFIFNGDNKQIEVKDAAQNVIGLYYYDGNGARVKKISGSETTIFVYNAQGTLVAEYSTQTTTNPTISYLTNDVLGSPRVITDNGGNVISRRDFMPFGEELVAGKANRTESMKYSAAGIDNVRKRFTGYEKDSETGLDFAEARMYDNLYGRFTAVDPLLASGQSADPQTFNRYIYVANNPISLTDPTGMFIEAWTHGGMLLGVGTASLGTSFMTLSTYYLVTRTTTYQASSSVDNKKATITIIITQQSIQDERGTTVFIDDPRVTVPTPVNVGRDNFTGPELAQMQNIARTVTERALVKGLDVGIALGLAQGETEFGMYKAGESYAGKQSHVNPLQYSGRRGKAAGQDGRTYQQALEYNIDGAIDNVWSSWASAKGKNNLWDSLYKWNSNTDVESNGKQQRENFANRVSGLINGIKAGSRSGVVTNGYFYSRTTPTRLPSPLSVRPCPVLGPCR